jgi:hypothetical protein
MVNITFSHYCRRIVADRLAEGTAVGAILFLDMEVGVKIQNNKKK